MVTQTNQKNRDTAQSGLIIAKVTQFITKMNLAPLPRNYELFYEILSGHHPEIGRDILALGNAPQQHDVDMVGQKHNLPSFSRMAADRAVSEVVSSIEQISTRLAATLERTEEVLAGFGEKTEFSQNDLFHIIEDVQNEQASLFNFVRRGLEKIREHENNTKRLQAVSLKDTLTSLPNRAAFLAKLADVCNGDDGAKNAALVLVNIDRFREINEKYGNTAGNKALRRLAALFRKTTKKEDFVARIGGNEFAFLFPNISQTTAQAIAERLRHSVEELRFATKEGGEHLTVSMGVAGSEGTATAAEFYGHAELALLAARSGARNCVIPYCKEVAQRSRNSYLMHLGA